MAKAKKKADKFRCGECDQMEEIACGIPILVDAETSVEMCWRCAARIKAARHNVVSRALLKEILTDYDLELDPGLVERILHHLDP